MVRLRQEGRESVLRRSTSQALDVARDQRLHGRTWRFDRLPEAAQRSSEAAGDQHFD